MPSSAGDAVAAAIQKLQEARTVVGRALEGPAPADDLAHAQDLMEQAADQLDQVHAMLEDMPQSGKATVTFRDAQTGERVEGLPDLE